MKVDNHEYLTGELWLIALAKTCKQNKLANYRQIIESHFNEVLEFRKFQKEFEKIKEDFEQIKQYFAVSVLDRKYIEASGMESFVYKKITDELFAVLVFDFPHTVMTIKPEELKAWGKTEYELFKVGIENASKNYVPKAVTVEIGLNKDILYVFEEDHFFVLNILFELENHENLIGKGGCLVATPGRSFAIIYPINDLSVVRVVNNLCIIVPEIYNTYSTPLINEIYWYKEGKFTVLPYENYNKSLKFFPPDEFTEMLRSLPT